MRKDIDALEYAGTIMQALKSGVLLTTKADDRVNTMTISWGTLGIEWAKPIFTVFVRENRFTRQQLDKNPEFTINIPHGAFDKQILGFCGRSSGRDTDKIKALNLTLETPQKVSVPAIKELPLTLECRIVYRQMQDRNAVPEAFQKQFYPQEVDSLACGANKDYHIAYYGEIVSAYIIE